MPKAVCTINGRKRTFEASENHNDHASKRLKLIDGNNFLYHMNNGCYKRYTMKSLPDGIQKKGCNRNPRGPQFLVLRRTEILAPRQSDTHQMWQLQQIALTHLAWTKWQPFCRRYVQAHFCEWKYFKEIYLKFKCVLWVLFDNMSALVQIMAWRRPGDKPLFEPMLTQFTDAYTYIRDVKCIICNSKSVKCQ